MSKTAFDRWTLGSVSESVAEGADATTLVVRSSQPFVEWERGERPLRIFVAVDFSAASDAALRWVGELRQLGPCEVTAGYVHWPPEERRRLGVGGPEHTTANIPEVQRLLERDLREKVNAALGYDRAEIRVQASWGRVDVPLIDLAVAAQADLLVVGTHQRRGLDHWTKGSVSRVLLRHAPMNVACVSAAGAPSREPTVRSCRRVLAAVDLSDHGGLALPYAYSVVDDGGTVNLVHVVKPFRWANSLISGMPDVILSKAETEERIAHGSACLRALIPAGMETRRIQTEVQIIEDDDVGRAICQAAESFNADLVCIGAHARPGAVARIMGSFALGVLQQCRRAVLVAWPPVA
jgi:nucleotide-binding universal stress UspA family protein